MEVALNGEALLVGGDIPTHVNGERVNTPDRLARALQTFHVGDTVRLTLFRAGQNRDVEVRLSEQPLLPQDVLAQGAVMPLHGSRVARMLRLDPTWR